MNLLKQPRSAYRSGQAIRRPARRIMLLTLAALPVLLVATLLVNTLRFRSTQVEVAAALPIDMDRAAAAERLAQAVRFRTVSHADGPTEAEAFRGLHAFLEQSFPRVHAALGKELVGEHSALYTWPGSDATLKPILLVAHLDVVPALATGAEQWTYPPFEGRIADGFVWGRGAMDDKSGALGMLEAVELLLGHGVQPARTVYLAFGHDEEIGGSGGAARIAALLAERKVALEYILDEGSFITEGILPGVDKPVAMIGLAEKGILNLELSVNGAEGHSSVPPPHTAIGELSTAIGKLEASPLPGGIDGVVGEMFRALGPEMPFAQRLIFANLWLFGPLVERRLAASPTSNALMRTTTAVTLIDGGSKENVLPGRARAVVNFRILPGDSGEQIVAHVRDAIDDPEVSIASYGSSDSEASRVSSMDGAGFRVLEHSIRETFPEVLVAPAQVLGATDSRHYAALSEQVYRFRPLRFAPEDVARYHGVDERIAVETYAGLVSFYYQLLRNAAQ